MMVNELLPGLPKYIRSLLTVRHQMDTTSSVTKGVILPSYHCIPASITTGSFYVSQIAGASAD